MRIVHSIEILVRSEEHDSIVMSDVSFKSLKALDGVVKGGIAWIKFKWLIWSD